MGLAALVLAPLAYGWFEAGWLRRRVLEVEVEGLPAELDGLRIAHLSDLHLGVWSRGSRAAEEAVEWVAKRKPEVVCLTGDLVSRRAGLPKLERLCASDTVNCTVLVPVEVATGTRYCKLNTLSPALTSPCVASS